MENDLAGNGKKLNYLCRVQNRRLLQNVLTVNTLQHFFQNAGHNAILFHSDSNFRS